MSELFLESSHELFYDNKNRISIPDLVRALHGLNGIAKPLPAIIEAIYGIKVDESAVLISKIEAGSVWQKFFVALNFGSEEEMEKAVRKFGQDHPMLKNVLNVLLAAVVLYALFEAATRVGGDTTNIEANNNVIINIGAGEVGMTPEGLRSVLESSIKDKDAVARASLNFVAPAKTDPDASIQFAGPNDETPIRITRESIRESPDNLKELHELREAHVDNALISVRAIDLDNRAKGWYGLLNGVKHRLPIALHPMVDAEQIHGTIYADIIVLYERTSTTKPFVPARMVIKRIGDASRPIGSVPTHADESSAIPGGDMANSEGSQQHSLF